MARFTGAKNKIARRFGSNIFGRLRNPLLHKPHPPGMHGLKRRKKSDYGVQLEEQQKLKAIFGMLSQSQLLKYYKEALRRKGNTARVLIELLETRLDIAVYRLKLASTIFSAQQLVAHGHILVNGKKVDIRSFLVKPNMVLSVREKSQKIANIKASIESPMRELPPYYNLDAAKFSGTLLQTPPYDEIPIPSINVPLVCEFLAHTA